MFPEIMHEDTFRYMFHRRRSLTSDLTEFHFPHIADGKVLKEPHCNTEQGYVHFSVSYRFRDSFTGIFVFHLLQGQIPFSSCNSSALAYILTRNGSKMLL